MKVENNCGKKLGWAWLPITRKRYGSVGSKKEKAGKKIGFVFGGLPNSRRAKWVRIRIELFELNGYASDFTASWTFAR